MLIIVCFRRWGRRPWQRGATPSSPSEGATIEHKLRKLDESQPLRSTFPTPNTTHTCAFHWITPKTSTRYSQVCSFSQVPDGEGAATAKAEAASGEWPAGVEGAADDEEVEVEGLERETRKLKQLGRRERERGGRIRKVRRKGNMGGGEEEGCGRWEVISQKCLLWEVIA